MRRIALVFLFLAFASLLAEKLADEHQVPDYFFFLSMGACGVFTILFAVFMSLRKNRHH